ncbi:MAG TPA: methyltransferase domain-containing protein, partial [Roseiflexaceae bacterium]
SIHYLYRSMADLAAFKDQSMDLVISGESIEHIEEADADVVCREAYRILKPNGYFCLDTPNAALTRILSPDKLIHPEHKKEYYVHELKDKLERAGFAIVDSKGICPMPESLRSNAFDYGEMIRNIRLSDNPEEGYLFYIKAVKPAVE